jgi:hypothetical protein
VKVAFQTQDERIKSGMSASVAIITEAKADVLTLPNAAVRLQGTNSTVQTLASIKEDDLSASQGVLSDSVPQTQVIEVGIANDENTEIMTGLAEGDQVVLRTVDPNTASAARTTTQAAGGLRVPGLGGTGVTGGGNFIRAGGAAAPAR